MLGYPRSMPNSPKLSRTERLLLGLHEWWNATSVLIIVVGIMLAILYTLDHVSRSPR